MCGIHPEKSRRAFLAAGLAGAAGLLAARGVEAAPIAQPARADHAAFMRRAVEMRALAARTGDQAFGAVVVKDGRIIGQAPSRVVVGGDPTAHGEMEAIRDAGRRQGTHDLSGAVLYTTFHPCPMCETAAHWAGIARFYHGEAIADGGAPRYGGCG